MEQDRARHQPRREVKSNKTCRLVSRSWAQNRSAWASVRSAPAPYMRAHVSRPSRKLSVARRRTLVVHAGGPRWLRLPEGPLAAPGRYRSPPGSPAPRCEVSPGSCRPLPVLLSGKRTWKWGLRRCRRGCPLLGVSLCQRATSSCGTSSSRIVILVSDKTKALGAVLWRGVSGLSRGGWRAGRGARVWGWADCVRGLD